MENLKLDIDNKMIINSIIGGPFFVYLMFKKSCGFGGNK